MANITKEKRDKLLSFLKKMKEKNKDDSSIIALNELENFLIDKKFGLVFEEHTEEVDEKLKKQIPILCADETRKICKDKNLPYNFIIEGDNLQALYLLEKTHRGRIDCIYIDPPYNTGAHDWKYNNDYVDINDSYRHSKWLSMMKTRLLVAKKLLNPKDSVLIVTIDEKEYLHLGCLLEELFPLDKIQMISSIVNHGTIARNNEFNRNNEYIFFVMIGNYNIIPLEKSKNFDEGDTVNWRTLRRTNAKNIRAATKKQFYAIYVNDSTKKIEKIGEPLPLSVKIEDIPSIYGCTTVLPIRDDGTEMMWGLIPEELKIRLDKGYVKVCSHTPNKPQKYSLQYLASGTIQDIEKGKMTINGYNDDGSINATYNERRMVMPKTQWDIQAHDARDYGTYVIKKFFLSQRFNFPKSLYAVYDCLRFFIANKPNAIILDFFAGSGTTLHAVNLLNKSDNGKRTCIMTTNNEVSEDEAKELKAKGYKPGDEEWEKLGIAKNVTWPRTFCSINGLDINNDILSDDYGIEQEEYEIDDEDVVISKNTGRPTSNKIYKKTKKQLYPQLKPLKYSDGFNSNVKYFKCDWTPRKPEDYLLSNVLCLHIKEMIELEHAIEVDNEENVIIFNKDDYKKYILDSEKYKKIKRLWVNQNILFNSKEIKKLDNKKFKYIPKEYFGQELKEAAE